MLRKLIERSCFKKGFYIPSACMKKLFLSVLLLVIVSHYSIAQDSSRTSSAKVYLLRATGTIGKISAFNIFMDDALICKLNNNKYSVHSVQPGVHKFQVRFDGNSTRKKIQVLELNFEAGESYYINVEALERGFVNTLNLIEVTANTFKKMSPGLKEDNSCK